MDQKAKTVKICVPQMKFRHQRTAGKRKAVKSDEMNLF